MLLGILLLAFALRVYHLDTQSFWSDEGISLQRAALTLPELLRSMPVEHTPGYFVLLSGWLRLAGDSDFALRFLSVFASVLAVALLFRLAVDLGRRPAAPTLAVAGAAAALLLATNGFQVWYAQEARMYAWLLAASLFSTWSLWRLLVESGTRQLGWGALYALSTAAVVYFHLYGALVPIAQTLFVVSWVLVERDGRAFVRWLLASLAAVVLFAPWIPHALGIFGFSGWRQGGDVTEIPWRYLAAYTVSDGMPAPWHDWLPWLYLALAAAGLFFWWRTRRWAAILLLLLLVVPFSGVLLLAARNPDYHERYTIYLAMPLLLLVGGALAMLDLRFWRSTDSAAARTSGHWSATGVLVAVLLLAGANWLAVDQFATNPALQKPDYRAAALRIMAGLQPGDVILVDGPDPKKVFLHYYRGAAPVYEVTDLQDKEYAAAGTELQKLTSGARRVWELLFFHNPAAVQVWLATQAWATEATDHNGPRVTLYGLADIQQQAPAQSLDIAFGPELTLQQVDVNPQPAHPGDLVRVSTHWFVNAQAPEYKFSLRLGNAAGETVQSVDYVPQNWFAPTNVWFVGKPATDQRGLLLPGDLPPGDYTLTLRLYNPATGAAVETAAGQDVPLTRLKVTE